MNTEKIRWALTGAGDVCEKKGGPPLYELPGHRLVAATCRNREKGEDFARRHGPCQYLESYPELLELDEVNAVYVATPPIVHCQQVKAAAAAGKHVLVEKPMAMSTAECTEMVDACAKAGVTFGVAYYRRCYPSILRAREIITQQGIGTVTDLNMNNRFPPSHRLDLMHFFGGDIRDVQLKTSPDSDSVDLHGTFLSGATFSMSLGKTDESRAEQVMIHGSEGRIFVEDLKGGSLIWNEKRKSFPPLKWTHWGLAENFGLALQGRAELACSGEEGRKSTAVLDVVSTLKVNGDTVNVNYRHPPHPDSSGMEQYNLLQ